MYWCALQVYDLHVYFPISYLGRIASILAISLQLGHTASVLMGTNVTLTGNQQDTGQEVSLVGPARCEQELMEGFVKSQSSVETSYGDQLFLPRQARR